MIAGVASGLGGRFFDELRDKQSLGYTVHAFATERALAGAFVAYIATSPEKEEVARRGLLDEFAKLRDEPGDGEGAGPGEDVRASACTPSASRAAARCWATGGCVAVRTARGAATSSTRACAR